MAWGPFDVGPIVRAAGRQKSTFGLVVLQLASGFLIAGSLLNIGSWFQQVGYASPGYDETELVGLHVRAPRAPLHGGQAARETPSTQLARVAAIPGVVAAAPLSPPLRAETGAPTLYLAGEHSARAWTAYTTPALVEVLGLRLIEGALDLAADGGPPPVLITRRVRERLFPLGAKAVGQRVVADDSGAARVAGVLEDFMLREPIWDEVHAVVLRFSAPIDDDAATFVVRARPGQHAAVAERLRTMALATPGASAARMVSTSAYASAKPRFQRLGDGLVLVFTDFGLTFAIIALVGAAAVSSFVVAARRREIGIRRALGATRADVLRHFLIESTLAATLGIGLGLALTVALLFGMRRAVPGLPIGLWQLAAAAVFMWVNAAAAALIPARRAARIPPTTATRGG